MLAAEAEYINIVQLLLDRRNFNTEDDADAARRTALLYTAEKGYIEVIRLLFNRLKVDINRGIFGGWNLLLAAFLG